MSGGKKLPVTKIFVDQGAIQTNKMRGDASEPPISVVTEEGGFRAHAVEIQGPSRIVYDPGSLPRVWIETRAPIKHR